MQTIIIVNIVPSRVISKNKLSRNLWDTCILFSFTIQLFQSQTTDISKWIFWDQKIHFEISAVWDKLWLWAIKIWRIFFSHSDYKLQDVTNYIKSLPCSGVKLVKSGTDIISEGVVSALENEAKKVMVCTWMILHWFWLSFSCYFRASEFQNNCRKVHADYMFDCNTACL